jgi:DNA-binding LytR/AlgR family response regulator
MGEIKVKVAICDDNIKELAVIKTAMEQYVINNTEQTYEIECFDNPIEFLQQSEKTGGYDILLLDICMPGVLGTDIAKEVRKKKEKSEIIFLTSSRDYAVEAFALKAAHYIIKPFSAEQFKEALNRAVEKFKSKQVKNINIKMRSGDLRFVELDEIMYVESFSHSQIVYLKNGENLEARETLTKLLSIFDETSKGQFICPYKGFIVNQKSIRGIESDKIILKNGKGIPIVKRNFVAIKQQYFSFMFTSKEGNN